MSTSILTRRFVLACAAFLLATGGPALAETVKGNGVIRTVARTASGFTSIALSIPARLEVKQGATESVTVEADENLLPLIETKVEDGSLEVKPARRHLELQSRAIRIVVQAKQVEGLAIGGSGSIVADALKSSRLKLDIGGSGSVDLKRLEADRVSVAIGGAGDVKLGGNAKRMSVAIGGSGDIDAAALRVDEAEVTIAGSGDASLAVRTSLQVTIAGSGSVSYTGDPAITQSVLGSGRVRRTGALPH